MFPKAESINQVYSFNMNFFYGIFGTAKSNDNFAMTNGWSLLNLSDNNLFSSSLAFPMSKNSLYLLAEYNYIEKEKLN